MDSIAKFMTKIMEGVLPYVLGIRDAYDPPLEVDTILDMLRKGPQEEQESIGLPKVVGGMKVDGSTYRVTIL